MKSSDVKEGAGEDVWCLSFLGLMLFQMPEGELLHHLLLLLLLIVQSGAAALRITENPLNPSLKIPPAFYSRPALLWFKSRQWPHTHTHTHTHTHITCLAEAIKVTEYIYSRAASPRAQFPGRKVQKVLEYLRSGTIDAALSGADTNSDDQ